MNFSDFFFRQAKQIISDIDSLSVERLVTILKRTRDVGGRLFLVGSGGGAGHASHAACDFRKICGFEAYCPTDNVSELTARINDDGWDSSIANYLRGSRIGSKDCLFVFSVGGGDSERNISTNLVNAIKITKKVGGSVVGIVGRDEGFTAKQADACVLVPVSNASLLTPFTEGFQALIWHLVVSHPAIQMHTAKWESVDDRYKYVTEVDL